MNFARNARSLRAGGVLFVVFLLFVMVLDVPQCASGTASSWAGLRREIKFQYRLAVPAVPRATKRVYAWIPMPFTDAYQTLKGYQVRAPGTHRVVADREYGNRFLFLDLTKSARTGSDSIIVDVEYRVIRRDYRALSDGGSGAPPLTRREISRELRPSDLIPITGRIAAEAEAIAGHFDGAVRRARALYDNVVESVEYDKSGDGWGRGDAAYACDVRKGNCTDFHSLFIGESRSIGIPARFIMGFPIPAARQSGVISGYHCWAEFYAEPYGWVPIDASEARKDPSRREDLFGGLDANRIGFTIGRDIRLPGAKSGPLNFVIYPHVEVDGRAFPSAESRFTFEDIAAP